MAWHKS
ncbi:unnamed protein product [Acanthoscelides obtectus]|nr:unnamed protein product [Acanthoscelides obtectus]CAK1637889.1 hypothetical protein AOBTE_LOCUS10264 [Acanthoscelides obtectus]